MMIFHSYVSLPEGNPEEDDKLTDLGEPIFGQSHLTGEVY